jgi:hypothetical protein
MASPPTGTSPPSHSIHITRFGEEPPPAPHIRSNGPNSRAIPNLDSLCSSRTKRIEREISLIKKEKSKPRHTLGIKHGNIPIQLDLWGNEVIFQEKRTNNTIWIPKIVKTLISGRVLT